MPVVDSGQLLDVSFEKEIVISNTIAVLQRLPNRLLKNGSVETGRHCGTAS